ncbi:MAG TPA: hypothetical protein VLM18_03920 [Croceibacterium sp.]|nr:hypothetical protein [Croceibacterium sp.]
MMRRRADSLFFGGIALLLIGYVLLGFWPSYFAAGLFLAPLPSLLVQIHALLFVGWIVLFATQILLVGVGQTATHRRLGQIMAWWAGAIALIGPATVIMALRRGAEGVGPGPFAGDLAQSLAFAILIATGFARRKIPAEHKRLMMLATAAIAGPAIVRWPFSFMQQEPPVGVLFFYLFPAFLLIAYDQWALHRIHRASWLGLALMVLVLVSFVALPALPAWQAFTLWVRHV